MKTSSADTMPADKRKLWETGQTLDPLVERYTVGDDPIHDRRLLPYEVYGSLAHAAGLVRIGVLTKSEFAAVQGELKALLSDAAFRIEREQEDVHTAVEQRLTARLGETGSKVHAGRSRNDQVQACLRLYLKDRLLALHTAALDAAKAWSDFGRVHGETLVPGYTHLQRAMPSTVGHWAAAHAEALVENARLLKAAYHEADASPLGSAAGYGANLPLERAYVAKAAGFTRVQRNTMRVQTSRPRLEAVTLSALAVLARDLGVLAEDLCLYATAEFGFVKLPDSFTTGSSIMPQKRNPDVVELTRARAALFPGWLAQSLALGARASGYHRDYQLGKGPLFAAVETAADMLEMLARLPAGLKVREDRCRAAVTEDTLATAKALALVKKGMPFREAYRRVADEARKADPKTAGSVELPDYEGAPGNPGFAALERDRKAEGSWSRAERIRLDGAWATLLKLRP